MDISPPTDDEGQLCGLVGARHWPVDLAGIRSIWYRDPSGFRFPAAMTPVERTYAFAEARLGLGGVLATLDVLWEIAEHPDEHGNGPTEDAPRLRGEP